MMEEKNIIIEFYPTPYGVDCDHPQTWENHLKMIDVLRARWTVNPMYTGVRGQDCFYEVIQAISQIEEIKAILEQQELIVSVQIAPVTVLNTTYHSALRVHLPLAQRRVWKRR